jgi:type I restriction enzyme S subunit
MRREAALPAFEDMPSIEPKHGTSISQTVPLSAVCEVRVSNVNKKSEPGELPVRLCNYTDVYENDYISDDLEFMRATASRAEIARFGLRVGDVIITKDSETPDDIGIPSLVDSALADLVCGYHLAVIRPTPDKIDPTFLAKQLSQPRIARYFGQQANGSTRYGLSITAIERTPIWLPSISQQRRIGEIARHLDAAITETRSVLAKLRQVRLGLLHDLLTYGLDSNGELRDPVNHPEQFKDSLLGKIPRSWQLRPAERLGEVRLGRQRSPAHERGRHLKPYLRVANVFDGYIDYSDVLEMNFTPTEQQTYGLEPGDILLNEGQSLELVGRSALYSGPSGAFCYQNTLVRFRCSEQASPEFYQALFEYTLRLGRFMAIAKQTTSVAHLGADRFAKMLFTLPSVAEQQAISRVLECSNLRLTSEMVQLKKLQDFKSGLMAQLLTGLVRAPDSTPMRPAL